MEPKSFSTSIINTCVCRSITAFNYNYKQQLSLRWQLILKTPQVAVHLVIQILYMALRLQLLFQVQYLQLTNCSYGPATTKISSFRNYFPTVISSYFIFLNYVLPNISGISVVMYYSHITSKYVNVWLGLKKNKDFSSSDELFRVSNSLINPLPTP